MILTLISIILSIIGIAQRCKSPASLLRRLKGALSAPYRQAVEDIVQDELETSGHHHPLAAAFAANPESEVHKFAMEIQASMGGESGLADCMSLPDPLKIGRLSNACWAAVHGLDIPRVRKMMGELEGMGMKP